MYKYTYKSRGFSIGCQPKDFEKATQENERFETIYYNRKLTDEEISEYELIDLNNQEENKMKLKDLLATTTDYISVNEMYECLAFGKRNNKDVLRYADYNVLEIIVEREAIDHNWEYVLN